uniref:Uncharacterized protein n=1 Tax=Oryza barthii TaxID=65489 RepID=A0A0D3FI41_9ORYZ
MAARPRCMEFVSQITIWGCQRTARRWGEPINVSLDEIIHGKGMNTKHAMKMSIDKDDEEAKMTMAAAAAGSSGGGGGEQRRWWKRRQLRPPTGAAPLSYPSLSTGGRRP